MADPRLMNDPEPTPSQLAETLTRAFPHGSFTIDPMPQDGPGVLRIRCRCDRAVRWVGELPSDVLAWWLADHDDDMFLTPEQRDRKYNEQLPKHPDPWPRDLRMPAACVGMDLLPCWRQALDEYHAAHRTRRPIDAPEVPTAVEVNRAVDWWNGRIDG